VESQFNGTTFECDHQNRLKVITYPIDGTTCFNDDTRGNQISGKDENGDERIFEYDDRSRLKHVTGSVSGMVTSHTYNQIETLKSTTDANPGGRTFASSNFQPTSTTNSRGFVTDVDYDALHRTAETRIGYGGPGPARTAMTYDLVNNLRDVNRFTATAPRKRPHRVRRAEPAHLGRHTDCPHRSAGAQTTFHYNAINLTSRVDPFAQRVHENCG
jgi:YD repeat-containing protein